MNDVMKWLGEQVGNILGVAGLVTGFIFWWVSRKPKRFGWQMLSSAAIIRFANRGALPLKVVYDSHDVDSPNLIALRFGNAGKAELKPDDFDGPVRATFSDSKLLACHISSKLNGNIKAEVARKSDTLATITFSMLNPGEWIDVQFITDGELEVPEIHARVAGQTGPVGDVAKQQANFWMPVLLSGMGIGLVGPLILSIFFQGLRQFLAILMMAGLVIIVFGAIQLSRSTAWSKAPATPKSSCRAKEKA